MDRPCCSASTCRRLEQRERLTKRPGYGPDGRYLPAGTTVVEGQVEGYTKLVGAGSIYTITPCTKEAALKAVEDIQTRPLMEVRLPPEATLPPAAAAQGEAGDRPADEDDEDEDEDVDEDDNDEPGDTDETPEREFELFERR